MGRGKVSQFPSASRPWGGIGLEDIGRPSQWGRRAPRATKARDEGNSHRRSIRGSAVARAVSGESHACIVQQSFVTTLQLLDLSDLHPPSYSDGLQHSSLGGSDWV